MASLLILRILRPEDQASSEFRYLFECLVGEASRVFSSVEVDVVAAGSPQPPTLGHGGDAVLLVGPANVLLRAPSIARMAHRLSEGASVVLPHSVTETPQRVKRPLYSLRDFDEKEADWLRRPAPPGTPAGCATPVSLWRRDALAPLLAGGAWQRLVEPGGALPLPPGETAAAGLFHQFADYYGEVRADVLPYVPEGTKEVLDVGCGRGVTGRFLRQRLGCRVTGVELNPRVAEEAADNLDVVIQGDVADLGGSVDRERGFGPFDVVLALELFEHLEAPEEFLRQASSWVRPGGRIVLSVPNVGHYSVVEDLLAGRWDYLPIGLLCYTHLRFFTRRTLEDWVRRCGFARFDIVAQLTELPPELCTLPDGLEVDLESLQTKGFYVVVHC
jgi:SAM-dependent methyltransferase